LHPLSVVMRHATREAVEHLLRSLEKIETKCRWWPLKTDSKTFNHDPQCRECSVATWHRQFARRFLLSSTVFVIMFAGSAGAANNYSEPRHHLSGLVSFLSLSERGTTRAEDAQGTPTKSHASPSALVYEHNDIRIRRIQTTRCRRCCGPYELLTDYSAALDATHLIPPVYP